MRAAPTPPQAGSAAFGDSPLPGMATASARLCCRPSCAAGRLAVVAVLFAEAGARAWSTPSKAEAEAGRVSDALARVPALRDAGLGGGS